MLRVRGPTICTHGCAVPIQFDMSFVARMTGHAQRLQVSGIPEHTCITPVRHDMVRHACPYLLAHSPAPDAPRLPCQLPCPDLPPCRGQIPLAPGSAGGALCAAAPVRSVLTDHARISRNWPMLSRRLPCEPIAEGAGKAGVWIMRRLAYLVVSGVLLAGPAWADRIASSAA